MNRPTTRLNRFPFLLLFLLTLGASACNMPRKDAAATPGAEQVSTAAAQTVAAQLTQAATSSPIVPTTQAAPTSTATNTLPPPSATPVPPTATPIPCDRAEFVKDVSYPDNTEVAPGIVFVKTWRLRNSGSCTWTSSYAVVFANGDAMGAPAAIPLSGNAAPGQTVDVSVTLTAPNVGGTYRGDFKMRNASNVVFGLGDSNKPFFVQIKVGVASGLLYDFLARANSAQWESGVGGAIDTTLSFDGADDDENGVAKVKDGILLEDGSTSSKVLFTAPKHLNDGFVVGTFPAHLVQAGDVFKARLGLAIPGGSCGVGKVKFQLKYKEGGTISSLSEWAKTCNGSLLPVNVDLSPLKGKTVQFLLIVRTHGDFNEDWAVWSSPRIEHP